MTDDTMNELDATGWRLLWSYAAQSVLHNPDPVVRDFLVAARIGTDPTRMAELHLAGLNRIDVCVQTVGGSEVMLRVLVLGDDEQWVGICHPPAALLGLDPEALALVTRAEAVANGVEPVVFDFIATSGDDEGPVS